MCHAAVMLVYTKAGVHRGCHQTLGVWHLVNFCYAPFMRLPESGLAYECTIVQRAPSLALTPDLPSATLDSETLFASCWLYILQQWPIGSK